MTAMREASASADPLQKKNNVNDRKFAFLNQITRPDYRSLPNSTATSQSSVPSTPITIPEQAMFREFGAPIATPEDEGIDELEIKSEPLLSPRRTFEGFDEHHSEEKENREDSEEVDTTIREDSEDVDVTEASEVTSEAPSEDVRTSEAPSSEMTSSEVYSEAPSSEFTTSEVHSNFGAPEDVLRLVESAPELLGSSKTPEEEEEIRKMTESFGAPRKAVLERVTVEETDDETETEVEDDDDIDEDVRRQIDAVSQPHDGMVFGWTKKEEKMEKPTSLPLRYELEADCSTPRRAEFSLDGSSDSDACEDVAVSSDEGVLQQSLLQLQKQLRKTDVRCSRLEKICEFQQRDIDSLRFEVDWKDKRIEYLQKTLQEMELSQRSSTSSN